MAGDTRSTTDFVAAALNVLADHGSEGLTIAALCSALGVTKGSFYHHFEGMPAFHTALLAYWEAEHSDRFIAISRDLPDQVERIAMLLEIAVALPHAAESAIRSWARSNPEAAAVQVRVDAGREQHLTEAFQAVGADRAAAVLQSRMALSLLIGVQLRGPVRERELRAMFVRLNEAFLPDLPRAAGLRLRARLRGA